MYKRNIKRWTKHLDFMIMDIFVLLSTFIVAFFIRHQTWGLFIIDQYRQILISIVVASIIVSFVNNSYKDILKRGYWIEAKETFKHVSLVIILLLVLLFVKKETSVISRTVIILCYEASLILCLLLRSVWKKIVIRGLKHRRNNRRVFLVTSTAIAEKTLTQLEQMGVDFIIDGVALADREAKGEKIGEQEVVCNIDDVTNYLLNNVIDEVLFCADHNTVIPKRVISECQEMGVITHMSLLHSQKSGETAYVEKFGGYNVITTTLKVASPRQLFVKRCMDIAGGLVGCFLTGLLCIYVVPKIKKADPGPAFFSQIRVGKHGREFKIYKFRSMYQDAEARKAELLSQNEMDGIMFKMENDPRILPGIGDFIRRTSIDEFPQFLNVLKGDMSLCGTRPPLPNEVNQYELAHYKRLAVKPGITGMWQVSGRSDITDFDEIVKLDSEYIREWNIGMDIKILLKTVQVVMKSEGAR